MQDQKLNSSLSSLLLADRMRHVAAYITVNKRDPLWQQIGKLLEAEASTIIHDTLNGMRDV